MANLTIGISKDVLKRARLKAVEQGAPVKKSQATQLLQQCAADGELLLSTRVLQEFYVVVTRKLSVPLLPAHAEKILYELASLTVITVDAEMIMSAARRNRMITI